MGDIVATASPGHDIGIVTLTELVRIQMKG
jgi:hypothetical protein